MIISQLEVSSKIGSATINCERRQFWFPTKWNMVRIIFHVRFILYLMPQTIFLAVSHVGPHAGYMRFTCEIKKTWLY